MPKATPNEIDAALTALEGDVTALSQGVNDWLTAMTNAFSSLLARIESAAPDLTPELNRIHTLADSINTSNATITSAIAQAKVEAAG